MIELNTMLAAYERALKVINSQYPLADLRHKETMSIGAKEAARAFCNIIADRLTLFERQRRIPETDKFLTIRLPFARCMDAIRWKEFGPSEGYTEPVNRATRLPEGS